MMMIMITSVKMADVMSLHDQYSGHESVVAQFHHPLSQLNSTTSSLKSKQMLQLKMLFTEHKALLYSNMVAVILQYAMVGTRTL